MKKAVVLLIGILLTIVSFGQATKEFVNADKSYIQLRQEYADYCNQIVIDTVTVYGIVKYEIEKDGEVLKLVPKDTIWSSVTCKDYKQDYDYINFDGLRINDNYLLQGEWLPTVPETGTIINSINSEPDISNYSTTIQRLKYCKLKLKIQSESDFWNWVDKNYLK